MWVLLLTLVLSSEAQIKRIKSISFDKGKVEPIFVSAGMSTMVAFNCDINEMISGNEQQVTLKGSLTNKRQMIITLAHGASLPTNVFVRCGQKTDPFVFDIVPSRTNHQDYVKINLSYGEPEEDANEAIALNRAIKKRKPVVVDVKQPQKDVINKEPEKFGKTIEVEPPRRTLDKTKEGGQ